MSISQISLDRPSGAYCPGDLIRGSIRMVMPSRTTHRGIIINLNGVVDLQLSARSIGLFEAFYSTIIPESICNLSLQVLGPGKLPSGPSTHEFELKLETIPGQTFYETYHGIYCNVKYTLTARLVMGFLTKDIERSREIFIHVPSSKEVLCDDSSVAISLSPDSLGVRSKDDMDFFISGMIHKTKCELKCPISGELTVTKSTVPLRSVELQLIRVETCAYAEGDVREATEIQSIQIADGDISRDLVLPIYMQFPRLFTCPTLRTPKFSIEFELNLRVMFINDRVLTETFPLQLFR